MSGATLSSKTQRKLAYYQDSVSYSYLEGRKRGAHTAPRRADRIDIIFIRAPTNVIAAAEDRLMRELTNRAL